MANDKLAPRLCLEQQAESERVEEPPEERMCEMEREGPVCRVDEDRCEERTGECVCRQEGELEVRRPIPPKHEYVSPVYNQDEEGRTTDRNQSILLHTTTSFLKY
jgi:hypothetical protein